MNTPAPKSLGIVPKSHLSTEQAKHLRRRLDAAVHAKDFGPPRVWDNYADGLYAVIDLSTGTPVGIVEASGAKKAIKPGWWLDLDFRGQGYGYALVDALAEYLKAQGVTGVVGKITIDGPYNEPSAKMAKRFQAHFSN
jgi:RimJ/RimL family protein N-acetyltransferase